MFAAQSGDSRPRKLGLVVAGAGLLMVIFSFFTWTSAADDDLSISVTGMGAVSLEISAERAEALGGEAKAIADLEEHSKSPGIITVVLGILIIVSAVMLVINRYPGVGALVAAGLALIAVFMSLEYLFAPGSAVLEGTGDAGIGYAAVGLWLVTLGACVAATVSAYATVTVMRSAPRQVADQPSAGAARPVRRRPSGPNRNPRSAAVRPNHGQWSDPERPQYGPRQEPGRRAARPADQTDRQDRRPSGSSPDRPASHRDSVPLPPMRRGAPNPGPDRGLPPMHRSGPPPTPPPGYRARPRRPDGH
ncbi:hypothetical protein [Williamsia sp.]|uniref:hypothetical protein n=1 Tax=Williamsia sp. TaxID=1872085 RepID=UPI002F925372